MSEQVRVRATVRGRVQMVGFRAFVMDHANGLHGTVANRRDGALECVVEGPKGDVDVLLQRLHQGPPFARVEAVEVHREPFVGDLPAMTVRA